MSRPAPARLLLTLATAALLAGCGVLNPPKPEDAVVRYAPLHHVETDPAWPQVDWQLALTHPDVASSIDTLRIVVRPQGNELQVYKGVRWAQLPSGMVIDGVLQALEDSDRIEAVARQGSGIAADYRLVLDLRRFEAVYGSDPRPHADIEISAKLLHVGTQSIVASRIFSQAIAAGSPGVNDVVSAFETGLNRNSGDIAGWVLVEGQRHHDALPGRR